MQHSTAALKGIVWRFPPVNPRFSCFTSTKVQILTHEELQLPALHDIPLPPRSRTPACRCAVGQQRGTRREMGVGEREWRDRRESRRRKPPPLRRRETGCWTEQGRKAKCVSPCRMCSLMCVKTHVRDYMASNRTHSIWPCSEHFS